MGKKYSNSLLKKIKSFREIASSATRTFFESNMRDFQERFGITFPPAEFSFHSAPIFDAMKNREALHNSCFGFNVAEEIMMPGIGKTDGNKMRLMRSASAAFYQTDVVARVENFCDWNSESRLSKMLEIGKDKISELWMRMEIGVVDFIYGKVADEIAAAFGISREDYIFSFSKLIDNETMSLSVFRKKFFEPDNNFACTKEVASRCKNICEPFVALPINSSMRDLNILTGDFRSDFSLAQGILIFPLSNVVYVVPSVLSCLLSARIEGLKLSNFKMAEEPENKNFDVDPKNFMPDGYVPIDIVVGNLFNMLVVTVQNKTEKEDMFRLEFSRNGSAPKILDANVNSMRSVSSYVLQKIKGRKEKIDRNIAQIDSIESNFRKKLRSCLVRAMDKFMDDFLELRGSVLFELLTKDSSFDPQTGRAVFPCVYTNFNSTHPEILGSSFIKFKNGEYNVEGLICKDSFMKICCLFDGIFPVIKKKCREEGFLCASERTVRVYTIEEFMKIDSLDDIFEKLVERFKKDISENEKKMLRQKLDTMLRAIKEMQNAIAENIDETMLMKNPSLDFLYRGKIESGLLDRAIELHAENAISIKKIRENEKSVFENINLKEVSYDNLGLALSYLTGDNFSFINMELWSSENEDE